MRAYLALLEEVEKRRRNNLLAAYRPYARQAEFHAAGATNRERLFMAGNQLGKTRAGGAEWAMHLTGRYPDWWTGKMFDRPVRLGLSSAPRRRKGRARQTGGSGGRGPQYRRPGRQRHRRLVG